MRTLLIVAVVVVGLLTFTWWWNLPQPTPVQLYAVERGPVETLVANTRAGTLKSCLRSRLSFNLGGQVSELLVDEGQQVQAGAVLMRLRQDDRLGRVQAAQARPEAKRKDRERHCRSASLGQRDYQRLRHLAERQLASADRLDQAETKAQLAQLVCTSSATLIREAEADLALQRSLLDQATLRAPFSGVVAQINGELGAFVAPSPPGIPTPPAVDLIDDSCLYVEAPIDEVDAGRVRIGMPVRISLDAFRGRPFAGQVSRIAPFITELEKQARTVNVEVRFVQLPVDVALLTGYSADVEILLEQSAGSLRIPTETLLEGRRVLRYAPATGLLNEVALDTGLANWRWTEVLGGLSEGERILASLSQDGLRDGVPVISSSTAEPLR